MDEAHVAQVIAMGLIGVAVGAWALALFGASKRRRWLGTVASYSVLAAIVFIGVGILMAISPAQATRWDHWLRGGDHPMRDPALWCVVLALVGIVITVGASVGAIFSSSDWGRRFRSVASYARLTVCGLLLASVVLWNLG